MGAGLALFGRRKEGTEFPVDIMLNAMETKKGTRIASVIRDITHLKEEARALPSHRAFCAAKAAFLAQRVSENPEGRLDGGGGGI